VIHDDARDGGHGGTIDPATVVHTTSIDGSPNANFLSITCPVCGATSTHPVGGGAQPSQVQQMFARKLLPPNPEACPCGNLAAGKPTLLTIAHLKTHADQLDGTGRWVVNTGDLGL
jgi:hypothetical protein